MVDSMMLAHVMTIIAVILSAFQGPDNDVIMTNGLIFPEKPDFDDDASMTKPHPDASSLVDDPTDEELNKWSEGLWQLMDKGFVDPGPAVEDGPPQNLYSDWENDHANEFGCSDKAGFLTQESCKKFWQLVRLLHDHGIRRELEALDGDAHNKLDQFISGRFLAPGSAGRSVWNQYVSPFLLAFFTVLSAYLYMQRVLLWVLNWLSDGPLRYRLYQATRLLYGRTIDRHLNDIPLDLDALDRRDRLEYEAEMARIREENRAARLHRHSSSDSISFNDPGPIRNPPEPEYASDSSEQEMFDAREPSDDDNGDDDDDSGPSGGDVTIEMNSVRPHSTNMNENVIHTPGHVDPASIATHDRPDIRLQIGPVIGADGQPLPDVGHLTPPTRHSSRSTASSRSNSRSLAAALTHDPLNCPRVFCRGCRTSLRSTVSSLTIPSHDPLAPPNLIAIQEQVAALNLGLPGQASHDQVSTAVSEPTMSARLVTPKIKREPPDGNQ